MSSTPKPNAKKKIGLNTVISWGASIVILGLMFKILHWKGGEWMIGLGLITESILFFILGVAAMSVEEEGAAAADEEGPPPPPPLKGEGAAAEAAAEGARSRPVRWSTAFINSPSLDPAAETTLTKTSWPLLTRSLAEGGLFPPEEEGSEEMAEE